MQNELEIKIINFGDDDYLASLALRDKILRKPIGLNLSENDTKNEDKQIHFGAFLKDKLVGCLILYPQNENEVKMRQVAVLSELQKTGIGKKLVNFAEEYAKNIGFSIITTHARLIVKEFYIKLDYNQSGEDFIEQNITHVCMYKKL